MPVLWLLTWGPLPVPGAGVDSTRGWLLWVSGPRQRGTQEGAPCKAQSSPNTWRGQILATSPFEVKESKGALVGVAQWIGHQTVKQRITSLIPSQGTCLGCGPGPQWGAHERRPHIKVSLPFFLPPFPPIKINKYILTKERKKEKKGVQGIPSAETGEIRMKLGPPRGVISTRPSTSSPATP